MSACVTLEEVLAAASARCASLVPETSGYLALALTDTTSRLPLRVDDRVVLLTTEGTVTLSSRGEVVAPAESARLLRDLLARLLALSAGSMPSLVKTARPRAESDRGADAFVEELEAALIPVNKHAARRALARLARETLRARENGKLKRAMRAAQAKSSIAPAQEPAREALPPAREALPPAREALPAHEALPPAPETPTVLPGLTLEPMQLTLESPPAPQEVARPSVAHIAAPMPAVAPPREPPTLLEAPIGPAVEAEIQAAFEAEFEPTPTILEASVAIEPTPSLAAAMPVIPELVAPARREAIPELEVVFEAAIEEASFLSERAPVVAEALGCVTSLTSPDGIEAVLVDFSPGPAPVAVCEPDPTPTTAGPIRFETREDADDDRDEIEEEAEEEALADSQQDAMTLVDAKVRAAPAWAARADADAAAEERVGEELTLLQRVVFAAKIGTREDLAVGENDLAPIEAAPSSQTFDASRATPDELLAEIEVLIEETPATRQTLPWPVGAVAVAAAAAPDLGGRAASDPDNASPDEAHAVAPTADLPPDAPPLLAPTADLPPDALPLRATTEDPAPRPLHPLAATEPAPHDPVPSGDVRPEGLPPIDAIVWSAVHHSPTSPQPAQSGGREPSRVDELLARFSARAESSTRRRAARSLKALAGLDLTLTPPPVAAVTPSRPAPAAPDRSAAPSGLVPAAPTGGLDHGDDLPPSVPRRRLRSLWLTLVALALVSAALVWALRPDLLASLAPSLAHAAQRSSPHGDTAALPADD